MKSNVPYETENPVENSPVNEIKQIKMNSRSKTDPGEHSVEAAGSPAPVIPLDKIEGYRDLAQLDRLANLHDLLTRITRSIGKKSFLVFKENKYFNVPTKNIALFYVKYESSILRTFDNREFFVNHSLEQIQNSLPASQFYRLNRQYLVNFSAVKDAEHYFARKLSVNLVIPMKEKLLVPRDKVHHFLDWLDNR